MDLYTVNVTKTYGSCCGRTQRCALCHRWI
ncbi:hypothetical protein ACFX2C_009982 [Malus domestica]